MQAFLQQNVQPMELLYQISLALHIASGYLALITGLVAMGSRKGRKTHRGGGRIFFISMMFVAGTALVISLIKGIVFLLLIGIFAFYQNYSGYRAVKNKDLTPNWADWIVLIIAALNGLAMIYTMNPVLLAFGVINTFLVVSQFRLFWFRLRGKSLPKLEWLGQHLGMMMGAYIATITAFLVVNIKNFEPFWLPWLAPTIILVPLLVYWRIKYTRTPVKNTK